MGCNTGTHRHRQQYDGYQRGGDRRVVKGVKYMVTEDYLIYGGGHTMKYTDDVSQNCTLETYMILLTSATPINSIKINENNWEIKNTVFISGS